MDAFGMQRTMFAAGTLDDDGYLRHNTSEPAWNLLRLSGPLDAALLGTAVKRVTAATDVLHLRVRATDRGPVLVRRDDLGGYELEVLDAEPFAAGRLAPGVAAVLGPLLFDKIDLPNRPAGRVCLVRGEREHLLALSFDHTVLDGHSAGLLLRAFAACYRSGGEYTPRGPSFADYLGALPDRAAQDANLARWQRMLAGHPVPGPALRLPGGRAKPPAEYRIDGYFDLTYPAGVAADLTAAVRRTGLSRAELLTAACALAVTAWSDAPQPMLSLRHGHHRAEDVLVIGPLVEPYVILPPAGAPPTVAEWLAAHREANAGTPALHGRSIREVTPLAPRNAALNIVPPARPVPFGPDTKATTVARAALAPLWAGGRPTVPSTAAFWANLFLDQPGRVELSVTHDTEVVPDARVLADGIAEVVAAAAHRPDTPPGELSAQLRRIAA